MQVYPDRFCCRRLEVRRHAAAIYGWATARLPLNLSFWHQLELQGDTFGQCLPAVRCHAALPAATSSDAVPPPTFAGIGGARSSW